jgi:hypothetical protein
MSEIISGVFSIQIGSRWYFKSRSQLAGRIRIDKVGMLHEACACDYPTAVLIARALMDEGFVRQPFIFENDREDRDDKVCTKFDEAWDLKLPAAARVSPWSAQNRTT